MCGVMISGMTEEGWGNDDSWQFCLTCKASTLYLLVFAKEAV
jgi:hypothetical protein